jgi:hypothetical protein
MATIVMCILQINNVCNTIWFNTFVTNIPLPLGPWSFHSSFPSIEHKAILSALSHDIYWHTISMPYLMALLQIDIIYFMLLEKIYEHLNITLFSHC